MLLIIKLVCVSIALSGVSSTNYLDYHGLGNVYQAAYAPSYHEYKPKDYKFEYGVSDPHTGDHKSQWEVKENGVVRGAYSLLEPDGTTRIVEYIADDDGFRAVVKKIGTSIHPTAPVIVQPARLAHVTSLYDHSSGVYAGTKENYIAAYQPKPIAYYQDHSAENVVNHAPLDDEVRIYFNNHDNLINTQEAGILNEQVLAGPQPHVDYVAPKEFVQFAQPEIKAPQILSVEPKVYYEPQEQILAQAQINKIQPQIVIPDNGIHQPIQPHQYLQEQAIQQHLLQHQQPIQHQIVQEVPLQHQLIQKGPIAQHQFIQQVPIHNQQIIHEVPIHKQIIQDVPIQHQQLVQGQIHNKQFIQEVPIQHQQIVQGPIHNKQFIQEVPIEHQQFVQGPIHDDIQQQGYGSYETKIDYQNGPIYGELGPIPYKTISEYKRQPHQNEGYDYDSY